MSCRQQVEYWQHKTIHSLLATGLHEEHAAFVSKLTEACLHKFARCDLDLVHSSAFTERVLQQTKHDEWEPGEEVGQYVLSVNHCPSDGELLPKILDFVYKHLSKYESKQYIVVDCDVSSSCRHHRRQPTYVHLNKQEYTFLVLWPGCT